MFQGKAVQVEVKCRYFTHDGHCTCKDIGGWFFGLGSKLCVSYASPFQEKCIHLKKPLKGIKYKN